MASKRRDRRGRRPRERDAPGGVVASHLGIMAYGNRRDRARFLEHVEDRLGRRARLDEETGIVWVPIAADVVAQLDRVAGEVRQPPPGILAQAVVRDQRGRDRPISKAWQSWEEVIYDTEEHMDEYLDDSGEDAA